MATGVPTLANLKLYQGEGGSDEDNRLEKPAERIERHPVAALAELTESKTESKHPYNN